MRTPLRYLTTATSYALVEHARNRFAMVLVAAFIPGWITLIRHTIPNTPVQFRLRATGQVLLANGNHLTQISGALNAVTLIVGFMMFAATYKSGRFDRRLAIAGYPWPYLLLAKVGVLVLASAAVAVYATAVISCYWRPEQLGPVAAGLFCAAMTYGALGVALGALLHSEVEGMFAIMMISIIDAGLQSPVANSVADNDFVAYLPSYGAMQLATGGGFSTSALPQYLVLQLGWFAGAALFGFLAFQRRTRSSLHRSLSTAAKLT